MGSVTSKDGTAIAYECQGSGAAVILVGGGLVDRSENAPLAARLARRFRTYNYDRRGRGESGDTPPYSLRREFEDIEALIAESGGAAHLYGISSGGALVLEAAAAGVAADRLAVYDVPYNTAAGWPRRWREYVDQLGAALAGGRRDEAVERFMRLVDTSDDDLAAMRDSPYWPSLEALAHTLAYDAACLGDGQPAADRLSAIAQPTLVCTGGAHARGGATWIEALGGAADAIAGIVPHARRQVLEGQSHVVDADAMAAVLERFFSR
jgi:alpha-beta hydrolase superfamily lysophospholipase